MVIFFKKGLAKIFLKTKRFLLVTAISFTTISFFNLNTVANAADATVNLTAPKQEIDGFGASSAWCGALGDNIMNGLYSNISNVMKLGKELHDCMVTGNMNGYVYW